MILEIFNSDLIESNACTVDEWLFLGKIFKNYIDHNTDDQVIGMFLKIFAHVNFTDPNHIREYAKLSINIVLKIISRENASVSWQVSDKIIKDLLNRNHSFVKAEDFIEIKTKMLRARIEERCRSDYDSFSFF